MAVKRDKKVEKTSTLKSLADADRALARLAELDRDIAEIEARTAEIVKQVQADQAAEAEESIVERKRLALDLELFARAHYDAGGFDGKRALELPRGFIGFRLSRRVKWIPRKVEDVIAAIRSISRATKLGKLLADNEQQIIRVKETPVKPAIKALGLSDDDYAKMGVRIETVDVFAYSTDKTKTFDLSEDDDE